jgi:hypothetical protein
LPTTDRFANANKKPGLLGADHHHSLQAEPPKPVRVARLEMGPIVRLARQSRERSHAMKTPIILALSAILAVAAFQAIAADRACRPSLSNLWHCPDTSASPKVTKPPERSESRRRVVKPVERRAPSTCCMICRTGTACGDSCIARDRTCHQPTGCACNG